MHHHTRFGYKRLRSSEYLSKKAEHMDNTQRFQYPYPQLSYRGYNEHAVLSQNRQQQHL